MGVLLLVEGEVKRCICQPDVVGVWPEKKKSRCVEKKVRCEKMMWIYFFCYTGKAQGDKDECCQNIYYTGKA